MVTDVRIVGKCGFGRGLVENDVFPRAQDLLKDRHRERHLGHGLTA
jgi:hypothetical protein